MALVEGEIVINRPVNEVFEFVADQRNEPQYNPQMRVAEKITDGPIGIGTRFRTEAVSFGRAVEMIVELTGYEPPRRLASSTEMSSMSLHGTLTFEPVTLGTQMHWSWELGPHGILKLMSPAVALLGRRQEHRIWKGLKRLLEGPKTAS